MQRSSCGGVLFLFCDNCSLSGLLDVGPLSFRRRGGPPCFFEAWRHACKLGA